MEALNIWPGAQRGLQSYLERVLALLDHKIVSVYVLGSLALGDYKAETSDIDLWIFVSEPLVDIDYIGLWQCHEALKDTVLFERIEASYINISYLSQPHVPGMYRPYLNQGYFRQEAFGHEWYLDQWILQNHGLCIYGEALSYLGTRVSDQKLKESILTIYKEDMVPLMEQWHSLSEAYAIFLVQTLCRMVYSLNHHELVSKARALTWMNPCIDPGDLTGAEGLKLVEACRERLAVFSE